MVLEHRWKLLLVSQLGSTNPPVYSIQYGLLFLDTIQIDFPWGGGGGGGFEGVISGWLRGGGTCTAHAGSCL